jgi:hypothetical protein
MKTVIFIFKSGKVSKFNVATQGSISELKELIKEALKKEEIVELQGTKNNSVLVVNTTEIVAFQVEEE